MAEPTNPTTAIALPERLPALLRIYDDLLNKFAVMTRNTFEDQRRGDQKIPSLKQCRELVENHVVLDPKNPGVPLVGRVAFEPVKVPFTWTVFQKKNREGKPIFKDGSPVPWFERMVCNSITCRMDLPGSKVKPHPPKPTNVQPAFTFSGMGNPMGYGYVDEQDALRMIPAMAIFIARFDIWTGEEIGGAWMIPMGVAELSRLDTYNSIVSRLAQQGSIKKWESIEPLTHALDYPGAYIDLQPLGDAANKGLMPSWRELEGADPQKPDGWIVHAVFGKMVKLDRRSQPIVIRNGEIPVQRFSFRECLNVIRVKVLGLPEEIGTMEGIGQTLDLGEVHINMLELFGVTLYDVNPRSGVSLIRNALQNPPIDRMVAWGLIPPGSPNEVAVQTLQGMKEMIREGIEHTVNQVLKDLVHNLGSGGRENPRLALEDVLGAEPTSELLQQILENPNEDNLLVTAILTSHTAGQLGLEVWDPKCWILVETYKALLLSMAKSAGVELPLLPETDETADSGSPPSGASSPAIVWRPDMKRDELYELAKDLEGITSKATKPTLVAALQAVCPPTPPTTP